MYRYVLAEEPGVALDKKSSFWFEKKIYLLSVRMSPVLLIFFPKIPVYWGGESVDGNFICFLDKLDIPSQFWAKMLRVLSFHKYLYM